MIKTWIEKLKVLRIYAVMCSYFYEEINWDNIDFSNGDAELITQDYYEEDGWKCIKFKKIKKRWMLRFI